MKSSASGRWITALASLGLAAALAACGSDGGGKLYDHGPVHACTGTFLCPATAYTGYDPGHTYKTPFSTSLKDVTWSLDDPSIGEIYTVSAPESYSDFGSSWAMVTTFKAGTTTVRAKSSTGEQLAATLVVSAYDTAVVEAGRNRYYTPDNPGGARIACSDCHTAVNGADHSPLEMEVFKDDEILQAIVSGAYPDGYVLMNVDHKWNLTDAEKAGIVPYLRSLQPKGFF